MCQTTKQIYVYVFSACFNVCIMIIHNGTRYIHVYQYVYIIHISSYLSMILKVNMNVRNLVSSSTILAGDSAEDYKWRPSFSGRWRWIFPSTWPEGGV